MPNTFNLAILYDIENLIGGYHAKKISTQISLESIDSQIQAKGIGRAAIQRAYANWADPRLNDLRQDIVKLGIEPVQMSGFGKGAHKNASDIHLALDALDIAFSRKDIDSFVIVSGDGGFSVLARKLHQYGKQVIGCAYQNSTSSVFKGICDDFIYIDAIPNKPKVNLKPVLKEKVKPILKAQKQPIQTEKSNPKQKKHILQDYFDEHQGDLVLDQTQSLKEAQHILEFFSKDEHINNILTNVGLSIDILHQALKHRLRNFDYFQLGFLKFIDLVNYVANDSPCKLVHKPPSEYRIALKDVDLSEFQNIESLTSIPELHTLGNYNFLLRKKNPSKITFYLPRVKIIYNVIEELSKNHAKYQDIIFNDLITELSNITNFDQAEVRRAILSLVSAQCFRCYPKNKKIYHQKLSLLLTDPDEIFEQLESSMRSKLSSLLGNIDEAIFAELLSTKNW